MNSIDHPGAEALVSDNFGIGLVETLSEGFRTMVEHKSELLESAHLGLLDIALFGSIKHGFVMVVGLG
jgi:hypothetical protein